jgi:hypothetical protein
VPCQSLTPFGMQPRTPEQYYHYLGDFASKNLGPFKFDEKVKRELAESAAKAAQELKFKYGLSEQEAANLTKMSLYDIFFLCGKIFASISSIPFRFLFCPFFP